MTERDILLMQVENNPEDKKLATNCLENMGVKELRDYLRKCNAARSVGEFNEQFWKWIITNETKYSKQISAVLQYGNHKIKLAYYGMVYTILGYMGCYIRGKNSSPIGITRSKYCSCLNLGERLGSNNVRKAIANNFYAHDYFLTIESFNNGEKPLVATELRNMEPIFKELSNEIKSKFC